MLELLRDGLAATEGAGMQCLSTESPVQRSNVLHDREDTPCICRRCFQSLHIARYVYQNAHLNTHVAGQSALEGHLKLYYWYGVHCVHKLDTQPSISSDLVCGESNDKTYRSIALGLQSRATCISKHISKRRTKCILKITFIRSGLPLPLPLLLPKT
jgi:hypothetical protein